jgi:putative SOS response-associated peptidase YedK
MLEIHDRMPVILDDKSLDDWLAFASASLVSKGAAIARDRGPRAEQACRLQRVSSCCSAHA